MPLLTLSSELILPQRKATVKFFDSPADALKFAEEYSLDVTRAIILEHMGRKHEAAMAFYKEGLTLRAIELLIAINSHQCAAEYILEEFWRIFAFGSPCTSYRISMGNLKDQLLDLLSKLNIAQLNREMAVKVNLLQPSHGS